MINLAVSSSARSERCCVAEVEHISEPEAAVKIAAADNQTAAANATNATAAVPAKTEAKDAKKPIVVQELK